MTVTGTPRLRTMAVLLVLLLAGCGRAPEPPVAEPAPPPKPAPPRQIVQLWTADVPSAIALCAGDWDGDQVADLLVADSSPALTVLGLDGTRRSTNALPDRFAAIECGRHREQGVRLLGYSTWSKDVKVLDHAGAPVWTYTGATGVNGAHWGDLDGDGSDEMIVGMNGFGGLHAVSADGQLLWQYKTIGNVWNQAVISAAPGRPAVIFATEAGGSIRVFDATGTRLRTLRPDEQYCSQVAAAVIDSSNTVQIAAIGQGHEGVVMGMNDQGAIAWKHPCPVDRGGWRDSSFASGDLDGDGRRDWAFLGDPGELVIVSALGEKIGSIAVGENMEGFVIVEPLGSRALLVTCGSGKVAAYGFE
jgi:hypothetical protein